MISNLPAGPSLSCVICLNTSPKKTTATKLVNRKYLACDEHAELLEKRGLVGAIAFCKPFRSKKGEPV